MEEMQSPIKYKDVFTPKNGLVSFQQFNDVPEHLRNQVVDALEKEGSSLPEQKDLSNLRASIDERLAMQEKYNQAGDRFAQSIDQSYDPLSKRNNTDTVNWRSIFVQMIQQQPRERIEAAVQKLRERYPSKG
jgi:hypothetical protein